MTPYPNLFSPIQLGHLTLPNRIVHVPTDISSSHADGEVSERDLHHHGEIARGGSGFIIVGATTPDRSTGRPTVTCLVADGDNYIPGLARLAESMHRYGAACAVQLQHPGRQCAIPRYNTLGATDRVLKLPWSAGHEIVYENAEEKGKEIREASIAEILELVDLFSEAAWRVKQAGFDAVELHAAHGYLLSEFMSPFLNMRTDRFGGSFENRMRFPLAVVDAIQKKCGRGFPLLVRYSFDEWCEGGRGLEEGIEIARVLERAGCAAVDLSMGMQESPGAGFDPMPYPQGWATYAAEAVKQVVRIPVITSHSLRDPDYCEQILAEGKTDLVGLARQLLADPYWPVKAKYGRVRQIRRCISCLGGCWQESLMAQKEIACSINAACGNAAYDRMTRTATPVHVAVVGGGPAGMEAARIATERGHLVTLFEKGGELGGALKYVCLVPGKEKMRWYLDWIRNQLVDLHVDVRLNHEPTIEELRAFDVVLNATGATSYVPPVVGDANRVVPFEESMACPKIACECHPGGRRMRKLGARVLLWGDGYAAADTAAFLASIGKQVTIVTEQREFGSELEVIHRYVELKRFAQGDAEVLDSKPYKFPVTIVTSTTVHEIREGEVVLQDSGVQPPDDRGGRRRDLPRPVGGGAVRRAAGGRHPGHQRGRRGSAAQPLRGGQGGLGLRPGRRRAPAVQPEPRDPQRAANGRPRPADARRGPELQRQPDARAGRHRGHERVAHRGQAMTATVLAPPPRATVSVPGVDRSIVLREAVPADIPACGRILYEAFATLAAEHGFPPDFPTVAVATGCMRGLVTNPGFFGVVAERDGQILGSSFLDERSIIHAIGPVSVDPAAQDRGVGRALMESMLERAAERHAAGVRLLQISYHNRSLSLYAKLGFDVRETFAAMYGEPLRLALPGYDVRHATADDAAACNAMCVRVHGHDRAAEVDHAITRSKARVVERLGRITGYTTGIGYFNHSVAETNDDLAALIGAASHVDRPGIVVPLGNAELFRWCLAQGLRVFFVMNMMTIGLYRQPRGAYLASVGY